MYHRTADTHWILREALSSVALFLCTVAALWLQYQVCVYWLPDDSRLSPTTWANADRIRFGNMRIVDWRTGRAWLDPPETRGEKRMVFPSPSLRVDVWPTSNYLTSPRSYRVTYKDATSDSVLQHFELSADGSLNPIGLKSLFVSDYFDSYPDQIERIDFLVTGPRKWKITLPPPPPGSSLSAFQFLWLSPTRLVRACELLSTSGTMPTSNGALPWRLELFQIEAATASKIASWQCPSDMNVHVEADFVTSLSTDSTQLEVRDQNGLLLSSHPVPWKAGWKPGDTIQHSVRFADLGFLLVTDTTTDQRTYFDSVTLQRLPLKDGVSWIQDYDRLTGRVVATSNQHVEVSWRDNDYPPLAVELSPAFDGVEVATKGSRIVAANRGDTLRFLVIDTDKQTQQHFDLRLRRLWAIAAMVLVFFLGCATWIWSSSRWRCPVWLDLLVLGGAIVGLHGYSAAVMGCSMDELTGNHWFAVPIAWLSVSSLWLVHGERSSVFRLSVHLIVITLLLMMTAGLDFGSNDFYTEILLMASIFPAVYLLYGVALVRGLHASDRIAPSQSLRITDLLFLMAALSVFLVSLQWVREFDGVSLIFEELMHLLSLNRHLIWIAIATACFGVSQAILAPYRRARIGWILGHFSIVLLVLPSSVIAWHYAYEPIVQSDWIPFGIPILGHAVSMLLFHWHGWTYRWRWGRSKVATP